MQIFDSKSSKDQGIKDQFILCVLCVVALGKDELLKVARGLGLLKECLSSSGRGLVCSAGGIAIISAYLNIHTDGISLLVSEILAGFCDDRGNLY
jgi:hypothetical protein